MEHVVGADGKIGVVAEGAAAEPVPGVDGMRADGVRDARRQVTNDVVEPRVVVELKQLWDG
jgi:hypothetical protein